MDTFRLGRALLEICKNKEDKVAEVNALFEILSEDQRREVVRYRDQVSGCEYGDQHAVYNGIECLHLTIVLEWSSHLWLIVWSNAVELGFSL